LAQRGRNTPTLFRRTKNGTFIMSLDAPEFQAAPRKQSAELQFWRTEIQRYEQ
jgi:hypothetical protein